MESSSFQVPAGCPFVSMSRNSRVPLDMEYVGPKHVPEQVVPASERGYLPSQKLLDELGFDTVPGATGWLMRRDEAHPIGHAYLKGQRVAVPNFQKIIALHRYAGTPGRTAEDWLLVDDVFIKQGIPVPAPNNDAEFRELVAQFDRAIMATA